jgi:O-antigen/teichoic acid export membrane protein
VQNAASNVLGQCALIALTFFSTPYITRKLGATEYGTLSLLMTYLFAFSLLNLGVNASLVKYLAELLPHRRFEDMQRYFGTSLTFLVGIGAVVAATVIFAAGPIVQVCFNGSAVLTGPTVLALRIASVAFILQFLSQVLSSIASAVQRFDILNLVRTSAEALRVVLTVAALSIGLGLPSLMAVVCLSGLCSCAAYAIAAKRLMPGLRLTPGFSTKHFRWLFNHSRHVLVVNLSNQVVSTADNFLIGLFLPVANVAYYAIPYTLARRVWTFAANSVSVVFPAASGFEGADQQAHIREIYLRGTKVSVLVGCYPALSLCVFSRSFLTFWLGPDYGREGALVLALLSCGFLFNLLTYVPYQVLQGTQHAATAARGSLFYSAVNLVLFVVLIPLYGIRGAAAAFCLAQLIFVPWFVRKANHLFAVRWGVLITHSYLWALISSVTSVGLCWFARHWIHSLFSLGAVVAAGLVVYCLLVAAFALDNKDRTACGIFLRRWLPRRAGPTQDRMNCR